MNRTIMTAETMQERIELLGPEPTTELLTWLLCADTLPDAHITVLMWLIDTDDRADDWFSGWWDGATWHDASHGGEVYGTVTHWAEPSGPNVVGNRLAPTQEQR